jgi:hypothetical protein
MKPCLRTLALLAVAMSGIDCASSHVGPGRSLDPAGLFSVTDVDGGFWVYHTWRSDIYVHRPGGDSLYIGTIESETAPNFQGRTSAPASRLRGAINLVVSKDGRSIVFKHAAGLAPKHAKLQPGVYRYTESEGVVLLRAHSGYGGWRLWENIGLRPRPMPSDILPWWRSDTSWAASAAGAVFPLILAEASPLHWAAFEGRTGDCAALIKGGADVGGETYWGYTPLDLALIGGHEVTAVSLLQLGAAARPGSIEWQLAVDLGRIGVIEALLEGGLAINAPDSLGNTMLHRSAAAALRSVGVKGFFQNITTPNSLMQSGVTVRVMQLLLDRGADPDLRNAHGQTALDIVTALIDTTPARPSAPPRRSRLPFPCRNCNYAIDSLMYEHAEWRATFNAHLIALRSILQARTKRSSQHPAGAPHAVWARGPRCSVSFRCALLL